MNYQKFCQYDAPIGSLTRAEIENPYLVFEDLTKKRSCLAFQKELSTLQKIIYLEEEWMHFDPGDLYLTYKDMIRLIEACYLIYKYSPALGSVPSIKEPVLVSDPLTRAVDSLFTGVHHEEEYTDHATQKDAPKTFLQRFYESQHLGFLKIDLYNYLQIGLNASYMTNCKYEYFALIDSTLMFQFRDLSELISEAYFIHAKGISVFPDLEGCAERTLASDKSRPSLLSEESIEKPLELVKSICGYYFKSVRVYAGLRAWREMLFQTGIWTNGGHPGNLLYLHENIIKLIDAAWLLCKSGKLGEFSSKFDHPVMMIRNFFEHAKMHEWKALFTEWLECGLSNIKKYPETKRNETRKNFKQLYKFIQAVYLLSAA